MEKYLYFRTVSAITDDDDSAASAAFPVSSFIGIIPSNTSNGEAADLLTLSFKPMKNMRGAGQNGEKILTDAVTLNITPGKSLQVIKAIMAAVHGHSTADGFITVADDVSFTRIDSGIVVGPGSGGNVAVRASLS